MIETTEQLQQALDNAHEGDVLNLASSSFVGPFIIKTAGITLRSANPQQPAIITDDRGDQQGREHFTVQVTAPNVALQHIDFTTPDCISLRIDADNCSLKQLNFRRVKIAILCSGDDLNFSQIRIKHFTEDGIRLAGDGFNGNNIVIEDLYADNAEAHHDGIQLYAGKKGTSLRHAGRFEGKYAINKGSLTNVTIRSTTNPHREAIGCLQGIFASDGFMDGIQLRNIRVTTHNCMHGISLRGIRPAMDGTPSWLDNVIVQQTPDTEGNPPSVNLLPARRLSLLGMQKYNISATKSALPVDHDFMHLADDESNLSNALFPPDAFRHNQQKTNAPCCEGDISKTPINSDWDCVDAGEYDDVQQRVIEYDANIGHVIAEIDVRFSCQDAISKSPIAYKKDAFMPVSSIGYELFYECLREQLFRGKLMQSQVDGINLLLAEWDKRQLTDTRYLAYILATTYHETAHTMQPIEEYGKGRGHRYGTTYYGRGFVQITWRDNYKRFSDRLDIDLVSQPERALEPEIAVKIIYDGMLQGLFTGKKLADYFQQDSDWYHARRIVNRLDRAEDIARIARQFWVAILMSQGQFDAAMAVPKSMGDQRFVPDSDELDELRREFLE